MVLKQAEIAEDKVLVLLYGIFMSLGSVRICRSTVLGRVTEVVAALVAERSQKPNHSCAAWVRLGDRFNAPKIFGGSLALVGGALIGLALAPFRCVACLGASPAWRSEEAGVQGGAPHLPEGDS